MVVLRGKVRSVRPGTRYHRYCTHRGSGETPDSGLPTLVEIEQAVEGGFLLVTTDGYGWSFVETWHGTMEEAKAEAESDFSICRDEWVSVNGENS